MPGKKKKKKLSIPSGKTNEITKLPTLITLHLPSRDLLFRFSNPLYQGFFFHDFECFSNDDACSPRAYFSFSEFFLFFLSRFFISKEGINKVSSAGVFLLG